MVIDKYDAATQTLSFKPATTSNFATGMTASFSGGSAKATADDATNRVTVAAQNHNHDVDVSGTAAKSSSTKMVAASDHTHSLTNLSVTSTFTGTGVRLIGSFSGTEGTITYTPAGSISSTSASGTISTVGAQTIVTGDPSSNPGITNVVMEIGEEIKDGENVETYDGSIEVM